MSAWEGENLSRWRNVRSFGTTPYIVRIHQALGRVEEWHYHVSLCWSCAGAGRWPAEDRGWSDTTAARHGRVRDPTVHSSQLTQPLRDRKGYMIVYTLYVQWYTGNTYIHAHARTHAHTHTHIIIIIIIITENTISVSHAFILSSVHLVCI